MTAQRTPCRFAALLACLPLATPAADLAFDNGANLAEDQAYQEPIGLPPLNPPPDAVVDLPTFDMDLGTLTSATLSWNSTMAISGNAVNGVIDPFGFTARARGVLSVFATEIDTGPISVTDSCNAPGCDILNVFTSSDSALLNLSGELDLTGNPAIQTAGPATFDVELDFIFILADASQGIEPIGPAEHFESGSFGGTWDITTIVSYEFVPVPAPPAIMLLLSGLAGFAGMGVRCGRRAGRVT